jgi:hypothetical protein
VLAAPREGAPAGSSAAPIPYRRCPVGVISDVDCPEYVGVRCEYFEDRGDALPTTVRATEVPLLAAELAEDFLTPRYHRRLAALRGATSPLPSPSECGAVTIGRGTSLQALGVPLNVPVDRGPAGRAESRAADVERPVAAGPLPVPAAGEPSDRSP